MEQPALEFLATEYFHFIHTGKSAIPNMQTNFSSNNITFISNYINSVLFGNAVHIENPGWVYISSLGNEFSITGLDFWTKFTFGMFVLHDDAATKKGLMGLLNKLDFTDNDFYKDDPEWRLKWEYGKSGTDWKAKIEYTYNGNNKAKIMDPIHSYFGWTHEVLMFDGRNFILYENGSQVYNSSIATYGGWVETPANGPSYDFFHFNKMLLFSKFTLLKWKILKLLIQTHEY